MKTRNIVVRGVIGPASERVDSTARTFIFQGGKDNVEWFDLVLRRGAEQVNRLINSQYYWTCPKAARAGDEAFIYLTAPLSRIVGRVGVLSDPFFNYPNIFDNAYMDSKWCVRIKFIEAFKTDTDLLTIRNLRNLLGKDWGWLRYPRGSTRIPSEPSIRDPFMELIDEARRLAVGLNRTNEGER